jgi:arylsulfatase A-like enzyme
MNVIVILCDTLRRDHCSPYTGGKPLNQCWSQEAPEWAVPTPNMDRLAARGTVFENAYCGSSPCMPARRDIYTGRYEFLERGWGPLEEEDLDLPRQVSGPPNQSIEKVIADGYNISYLITDHFHLWEKGSGNYHMGYTGFDFIRGVEGDGWYTHPRTGFELPEADRMRMNERHWRNVHHIRRSEEDWFSPQVFRKAAEWVEKNHEDGDFYLHLDCFDPHEPWDPPKELVEQFDPQAYEVDWSGHAPYSKWKEVISEEQFRSIRARYAANVVLVDRWLGHLMDTMDRLNLWENTMVIFTTDHGTYNGDHGRTGKLQTHQHDAVAHIPFIVVHPEYGQGERREQLVQLVDIYPTALAALGRPIPEDRHGVNLLPVLENPAIPTRDYAISGIFGTSISITDGEWILHQSPVPENTPLYWYGYCLAKFLNYDLGSYENGRREVLSVPMGEPIGPGTGSRDARAWMAPTWLSNKRTDMNELENLADDQPDKLAQMQQALHHKLVDVGAPVEQLARLGVAT